MRPTHDTDRPDIMADALNRRAAADSPPPPPRPGPIAGPRPVPMLPATINGGMALIVVAILAALAGCAMFAGPSAALTTGGESPTPPAAQEAPTTATATPPTAGRAWWVPGGEELAVFIPAHPDLLSRCATHPDLVLVRVEGGGEVWLLAASIGSPDLSALPNAPGVCAPPTPPAPPAPPVPPVPAYIAPTQPAPTEETAPTAAPAGDCPPPFRAGGCRNYVALPQG
jgi:hypothetical protein